MKHILVVEDDSAIRDLLHDILADNGYSVATAPTGGDALVEMRERAPDLVLLDLMLPDMTGWSFLRARNRDTGLLEVPVLVISAAGPEGLRDAQELGAPVFVSKPFDLDHLLTEVERLCEGPIRQCAWCGRVMDDFGRYRLHSGQKLRWASHGICPECRQRERRDLIN